MTDPGHLDTPQKAAQNAGLPIWCSRACHSSACGAVRRTLVLTTMTNQLMGDWVICRAWQGLMADQALDVELPAALSDAQVAWLAASRVPVRSLRFRHATPPPSCGDGADPGAGQPTNLDLTYKHIRPSPVSAL